MRIRRLRPPLEGFLDGGVVLPLVATWVGFSCSRWFGLPDIPGLPQITVARCVLAALVGYAGVRTALRRRPFGRLTPAECVLWLLVAIATMSGLLFGGFTSGYAGAGVSILFNFLLFPAVVYSLLLRTRYSDRDLARFCLILVVFGIYLGLTAVLERTSVASLLIPPAIADPTIVQHWGRSRGPFLQAEFNGAVMAQLVPVALLSVSLRTAPVLQLAYLAAPLLCIGTYLTETRAALLSLVLAVTLGGLFRHATRPAYRVLCLAGGLAALAIIGAGGDLIPRLNDASTLADRVNLLLVTVGMIAAHPVIGIGFGNFDLYQEQFFLRPQALGDYSATSRAEFWAGGTHNTLLTPLAELGLVAGVLYLGLVLWSVVTMWRMAGSNRPAAETSGLPMCAALVGVVFLVNALFVELRFTPTPNALFWVMIALAQRRRQSAVRPPEVGRGPRTPDDITLVTAPPPSRWLSSPPKLATHDGGPS